MPLPQPHGAALGCCPREGSCSQPEARGGLSRYLPSGAERPLQAQWSPVLALCAPLTAFGAGGTPSHTASQAAWRAQSPDKSRGPSGPWPCVPPPELSPARAPLLTPSSQPSCFCGRGARSLLTLGTPPRRLPLHPLLSAHSQPTLTPPSAHAPPPASPAPRYCPDSPSHENILENTITHTSSSLSVMSLTRSRRASALTPAPPAPQRHRPIPADSASCAPRCPPLPGGTAPGARMVRGRV